MCQESAGRMAILAEIQYLLRAEEQLLQLISSGVALSEVLHKICNALDLELGNMISLVSLPYGDATGLDEIAKSAEVFGLHKFCSASVVAGDNELLGSLEMYCSVPRRPFLREVELIERATCLAAIAITRHNEAGDMPIRASHANRRIQARFRAREDWFIEEGPGLVRFCR